MSERVDHLCIAIVKLKEAEPTVLGQLDKRIRMAREELKTIDASRREYQE